MRLIVNLIGGAQSYAPALMQPNDGYKPVKMQSSAIVLTNGNNEYEKDYKKKLYCKVER